MWRVIGWGLMVLGIGCGGGGGQPGESGTPDPGPVADARPDASGCRVKEDCPALPCRLAVCLAGECEYQVVPEGAACSDPAGCVVSGVCDAQGACVGEWACDDANPCTTDRCEGGQCTHAVVESGPCDDGDPCTEGDVCVEGVCVPGGRQVCVCESDNDCPAPTDLCLGRLLCDPETRHCVPDPDAKVTCEPLENPCRDNRCDPKTGQCKEVILVNGTSCDLGKCQEEERCLDGECVGKDKCVSTDPCKVATCDEKTGMCGAKNAVDGTACDDGNPCSTGDQCTGGVCQGTLPPEVCNGVDDDCDGQTDMGKDLGGCKTYYVDGDYDGHGNPDKRECLCGPAGPYSTLNGGDCHDGNANVHPGATEVCNGTDDDCDGVTDGEGSQGCVPHYKDGDGDGAGVTGDWKCLCGPAGSYKTTKGGDCDDGDAAVHPGAGETCNNVDDDCDGATDEGEGNDGCSTWYRDQDKDGFGTTDAKCLCRPAGEYTSNNNLDCDDEKAGVHPGATEVCNNLDDDCSGDTDSGENLGGCKAWYWDYDGDGYGTSDSKCLCKATGTYRADKKGDCNDTDAAIHPGGKVCGKDGDCDGKPLDVGEECDDQDTVQWNGCNACNIAEFQVNNYTSNDQKIPAVAFPGIAGDQGYFVAWEGLGCYGFLCSQTDFGVWLRRFDGTGTAVSSDVIANPYTTGAQGNASIAASPNGAVVAWDGQGSDTMTAEIFARRFKSNGTALDASATVVNQTTGYVQRFPRLVCNADLAFRIVWETTVAGGTSDIALRAFSKDLIGGNETVINIYQTGNQGRPRIAIFDGFTKFVVAWESSGQDGSGAGVYVRRFNWDATALDPSEWRANVWTTGSQHTPSVAGNTWVGGGFVVAWAGRGSGSSDDDIWARPYLANGTPVTSSEVRVNAVTSGTQSQPDVAMFADGGFAVVWVSGEDVFLRRFKNDQSPAGPEVRVNTYVTDWQYDPALSGAWDGTVLVSWTGYGGQDGSGAGIFAQRFGPNGERLYR